MILSDAGLNLIKRYEGCRLKAYKAVPTEAHWTIGWGHYGSDVKEGQVITQSEADALLVRDVQRFVDGVNKYVKVSLNQNQFDALVSFSYNTGLGALQGSTLLTLVNQREFIKASLEFLKWNKSGGVVLTGLMKRRQEEKSLFVKEVAKPVVKKFDYEGHTFEKEINRVKELGLMGGYPDGNFKPNEPLTRGQFAKVITALYDKLKK